MTPNTMQLVDKLIPIPVPISDHVLEAALRETVKDLREDGCVRSEIPVAHVTIGGRQATILIVARFTNKEE